MAQINRQIACRGKRLRGQGGSQEPAYHPPGSKENQLAVSFSKLGALLLLPVLLIAAFLIYAPGLHGYFLFDDYPNIVNNAQIRLNALTLSSLTDAALSSDTGPLGRPISMASFALDAYFHSIDPYYFKLTNVCIHLINGLLIFRLALLLLSAQDGISVARRRWVALAVAAAWLLHPLNLTSVLYIVQRMTSLSASFTLLGLICYAQGRLAMRKGQSGWPWIGAAFLVMTPLATFAKENGALFPLYALTVEACFFRFTAGSLRQRRALFALFGITVALPALTVLVYTLIHPQWIMSTYALRGITLPQRLYTEARILCFYVRLLVVPDPKALAMYHDDIAVSAGLLAPPVTALACLAIIGAAAWAIAYRKRHPAAAFAILFFLAGHSMESSFLPLELAHEHRNYLPIFGLLFGLMYYLLVPLRAKDDLRLRVAVAVVAVGMLAGVSLTRAAMWGDPVEMKLREAEHHPDSVRANIEAAAFYAALPATTQDDAQEYYGKAYGYYAKASSLSSDDTLGLFGLIALNSRHGAPLEPSWIAALEHRVETKPMTPNTVNALEGLAKCVREDVCANISSAADAVFSAALRNPSLSGTGRADVMFAWGDMISLGEHDPERAVKLEREAAAIVPNDVNEHLNLAVCLINAGHNKEALQVIEQSRKMDKFRVHAGQLDYLTALAR